MKQRREKMREKIIEIMREFNEELVEDMNRDLLATDILDSFDIVKLVVEFEDAFDIMIDVDEVTPENFQTANKIVEMIARIVEK